MSDEEAVGVVSNLVRVQAVIGTGAAVREGVDCFATPVHACLPIGFASPGQHCCKGLHRRVGVAIMQRLSALLQRIAQACWSCYHAEVVQHSYHLSSPSRCCFLGATSWLLVPRPSYVK